MNLRRLAPLVFALVAFAAPATARVNEMNPRPAPAPTAETPRQSPRVANPERAQPERAQRGSSADEQRYAERAKASKKAEKFRGGEPVVVITATAAIIILLGVIIILLLT
jgi:hypothetical protein